MELLLNPKLQRYICNSEEQFDCYRIWLQLFLVFLWAEVNILIALPSASLVYIKIRLSVRGKGCQEMEKAALLFYKCLGLAEADKELISLYHTPCFFWNRP